MKWHHNTNTMTEEYLKAARLTGQRIDTAITETELLTTNDGVKSAWDDIQRIRALIAEEQVTAMNAVKDKYEEELHNAYTNYALLISLSR
jgi:hypothetical protein